MSIEIILSMFMTISYSIGLMVALLALMTSVKGQMYHKTQQPSYSIREASYVIVAPGVVRPRDKVRISCTIMNNEWHNLFVKALIFTDEQEIASGYDEFIPNVSNTIALTIPTNARQGNYRLRIYGKLPTGEVTFSEEKSIIFEQKAVSIFVQLEKPDYRHETIIRFRCIAIYPDLSPYFGTLDAFLITPTGIVMKRWENQQTNTGVVSLAYYMYKTPPPGLYTVKCTVMDYSAIAEFEVYEFYQWKFEVNVSMPHYYSTASPGVAGVVVANHTTGRAVFGSCKIRAFVKNNSVPITDLVGHPYLERVVEQFNGVIDFFFSMGELLAMSGQASLNHMEVVVEAQVEAPYFNDLSNGSFITTLYDPQIKLSFLGKQPRAFKPRNPYTTFVAVSQQDGSPLPELRQHRAFVRFKVEVNGQASSQTFIPIGPQSMVSYTFTPDYDAEYIKVIASFVENDLEDSSTVITERAIRYRSVSNSFIYVSTSTINPQVRDYMIFTVRVSNPVDQVFYHIVSNSRIVVSDVLNMAHKQKTFDVGLTRDMAPSAHIVVYYIRYDGEVVADSLNFHVNASTIQNKVNMTINRRKDFTGDTVEILAYASPQSFVGFAALDDCIVRMFNGGNIITELMLYDELYSFDKYANVSFSHTWMLELGFADTRVFFPSQSYAYDALSTFTYSGLTVFTDLDLIDTLNETCARSQNLRPCLDGLSCFEDTERCDGVCQCERDCVDESDCLKPVEFFRQFHHRFYPKIERIYKLSWLWKDTFTLPDGRVQFIAEVSKDIANYVVNAFAISKLDGFGILKIPDRISTTRYIFKFSHLIKLIVQSS